MLSNKGWHLDPALITDLMIVGDHAPNEVCVQSITITPFICSVVLGDASTGESLASVTVVAGENLDTPLTPLVDGIGGFVSFGSGLMPEKYSQAPRGMHIFGKKTLVESRCVLFSGPMPVTGIVTPGDEGVVRGDVVFALGQNMAATVIHSEQDGDPLDQVTLYLKNPLSFVSPCEEKVSPCECSSTPIGSINGVRGNTNGVVFIEIEDADGSLYLLGQHTIALLLAASKGDLCQEIEEPDEYGRIKGPSGLYSDDLPPITPYNSPDDTTFPLPIK
jgi:hypothetical protein